MNNGGFDLWYQIRRFADLDPVTIDGPIFRLHYWVTSTMIFAASAVAFAKQYFGDPIECIFVSSNISFSAFAFEPQILRHLKNSTSKVGPAIRRIFAIFRAFQWSFWQWIKNIKVRNWSDW